MEYLRPPPEVPFSFLLKGATHPCPCGYLNHEQTGCRCSEMAVQKYLAKISGPLLDRIDLHIEVNPVSPLELATKSNEETSEIIRERVIAARKIQTLRFEKNPAIHCNAQMNSAALKKYTLLNKEAAELLLSALQSLKPSGRAHDRILKVSRTIADLEGSDDIRFTHLSEAIGYRSLDRQQWLDKAATGNRSRKKSSVFKVA